MSDADVVLPAGAIAVAAGGARGVVLVSSAVCVGVVGDSVSGPDAPGAPAPLPPAPPLAPVTIAPELDEFVTITPLVTVGEFASEP
jgi:hypothetical protein